MKIDVSNIIDKELATFVDDGILLHKEIKKYFIFEKLFTYLLVYFTIHYFRVMLLTGTKVF